MARGIRARFNDAEVRAFLADPAGPVAHLIENLGGRAAIMARAIVRKRSTASPGKSGRPGTSAPPGATLASIRESMHIGPAPGSVHAYLQSIGSDTPWSEISASGAAVFLEKGTKRHWIHSTGPWSLSNYGTGYFGPVVDHPGIRPYPFLTTALWSLEGQV